MVRKNHFETAPFCMTGQSVETLCLFFPNIFLTLYQYELRIECLVKEGKRC